MLEEYLRRTFDRSTLAVALDIFRAGRNNGFKSADGMIDYSPPSKYSTAPCS